MVIISETRTPRFRPPSTKQSPAVPGRQRPLLSVKNAHLSQPSGEPKIFSGVNPGWILLTAFRISPADAGVSCRRTRSADLTSGPLMATMPVP